MRATASGHARPEGAPDTLVVRGLHVPWVPGRGAYRRSERGAIVWVERWDLGRWAAGASMLVEGSRGDRRGSREALIRVAGDPVTAAALLDARIAEVAWPGWPVIGEDPALFRAFAILGEYSAEEGCYGWYVARSAEEALAAYRADPNGPDPKEGDETAEPVFEEETAGMSAAEIRAYLDGHVDGYEAGEAAIRKAKAAKP